MRKIPQKYVAAISWSLAILGIVLILLGCWLRLLWLLIAAIVEMLGEIVFLAIYNRCSHCGRFLGHAGGAAFCPYCGERLNKI